jgi:hypothetical protein
MPRIFRNKAKRSLSLRINSNLSLAVSKLRLHHGEASGECWAGPKLEAVWHLMTLTSPPQLVVFELWYGDELIAADFAHPVAGGRIFYVATRYPAPPSSSSPLFTMFHFFHCISFFERSEEIKQLQPGFLLALLECKFLRDRG